MFEPRARVRRERRATALAKEVVVVLDDDAGKTTTTEKRRRWTRRGGLRGGRVRGRARMERSAFLSAASKRLKTTSNVFAFAKRAGTKTCTTRKHVNKGTRTTPKIAFLMFNERNTKRVVTIRGFGERCDVDVVERNPLVAGQRHTEGTQHAHMEDCLGYRHIGVLNGLLDAAFLIALVSSFVRAPRVFWFVDVGNAAGFSKGFLFFPPPPLSVSLLCRRRRRRRRQQRRKRFRFPGNKTKV